MHIILSKLESEFNACLDKLEKENNDRNEKALNIYNETVKKNNEKCEKMIKDYRNEFNYIIKNVNALYDVYCVTLWQANYFKHIGCINNTLDNLPDLNLISYNIKYSHERIDDISLIYNNAKLYKTDEIIREFKEFGVFGVFGVSREFGEFGEFREFGVCGEFKDNTSPYYEILYNKYTLRGTLNRLSLILEKKDIIVIYTGLKILFYRLSNGDKIYETPFNLSLGVKKYNLVYYNNTITFVQYYTTSKSKFYSISFDEYNLNFSNFNMMNINRYTYNSKTHKWVEKICKFKDGCKPSPITYNETSSEIYFMKNSKLYIVQPNKTDNTSTYNIIDLDLEIYKADIHNLERHISATVIDVNISKSSVKLHVEISYGPKLNICSKNYIYNINLKILSVLYYYI